MPTEASYYEKLDSKKVKCHLCPHNCTILPDHFGICYVRKNKDGLLYSMVYGQLSAMSVDPVEKKPLYHFFPATQAFSICTVGCNLDCPFCQNHHISQDHKGGNFSSINFTHPSEIVRQAKIHNCKMIAYTYTEPSVYFEYALEIARIAKHEGIYNAFVTNGYINEQPLTDLKDYLSAANVDLKGISDSAYKRLGGKVKPVLDTILRMKKMGIWIEITTLIVPGINDSIEELRGIAKFIADCGKDIPWHISRFHPDYKYLNKKNTPFESILTANELGKSLGLKYIYFGNIIGHGGENTYCPNCNSLLIERYGFNVIQNRLTTKAECPNCKAEISGVFSWH